TLLQGAIACYQKGYHTSLRSCRSRRACRFPMLWIQQQATILLYRNRQIASFEMRRMFMTGLSSKSLLKFHKMFDNDKAWVQAVLKSSPVQAYNHKDYPGP